jgi:1,2-phenylacetyl-CoA epoxidase catalytic subunit
VSRAPLAPEGLDPATRQATTRLVLTLADSKRLMGIRYSDWILGAPSIEAGIAASSMAQDEWGHARLLYAMLKGLGLDPVVVEHERAAEAYSSLACVDVPFPDWAAAVAGIVVVDGALRVALDAFARGCYEPARSRVPKMLAEETFHVSLGAAWWRRLAEGSREARALMVAATEAALPAALAWLGADDRAATALAEAGVTDAGAPQVAAYRDALRAPLAMIDLDVDGYVPAAGWDERRGRGPGCPDEDSVLRARGDLNRALFVE